MDNTNGNRQFRRLSPAKSMRSPSIPSSPLSESTSPASAIKQQIQFNPLDSVSDSHPRALWEQETQSIPSSPSPSISQRAAPSWGFPGLSNRWILKKRRIAIISALSLIVMLGAIGFSTWHFVLHAVPDVTLYRVSMQNVSQDIGGGGIAYPVQRLDISYPFSSHILSVFVKPGDKVAPNSPLVQIDLTQVNAQNIGQLNAQVVQAQQDMLAAQSYLSSVSGTGNSIVIAQARQQYTTAQARYNELLAEANAPSLHQGNIISALKGIVTAVNVFPGQFIGAGKVMLTIFDESSIIVRAQISLSNYNQVYIKQSVQVVPSALPGQSYNGNIISIIPNANSQSGTFEVWVEVANINGSLLPGMSAFVRIQNTLRGLVVPRLAVLNPDQSSIVFIIHQQHAYIQHVQVSAYVEDSIIISSGLMPDDLIVLVGLDSLQNGQVVHVTNIES